MPLRNRPALKLRHAVEDVGWHAREAALAVEEGVIWRGADAARDLADRASDSALGRATLRLRWLVERRIAWPLADELRDCGEFARTAITAAAVALALAAATGGAITSRGGEPVSAGPSGAAPIAYAVYGEEAEPGQALEGVAPTFADEQAAAEALPAKAQPVPHDPLGKTAWDFAQAFVLYEVGEADRVRDRFARICTPALTRSLAESPPRLPANVEVPKARVLNVVMGKRSGRRAEASVSLVRLEAVSEIRLTLERSKKQGWRVSEVRG